MMIRLKTTYCLELIVNSKLISSICKQDFGCNITMSGDTEDTYISTSVDFETMCELLDTVYVH